MRFRYGPVSLDNGANGRKAHRPGRIAARSEHGLEKRPRIGGVCVGIAGRHDGGRLTRSRLKQGGSGDPLILAERVSSYSASLP